MATAKKEAEVLLALNRRAPRQKIIIRDDAKGERKLKSF
jgi:hypothetical protein